MLCRCLSASLRLLVAIALALALLLPAFNLPATLLQSVGLEEQQAHDTHEQSHDHEDGLSGDAHGDHKHNVADHTHDTPNSQPAIGLVTVAAKADWQLYGLTASCPKAAFNLERPPRHSAIA